MASDNSNDTNWFDQCIEYDEVRTNSDSEKENNSTIRMKQPNTTKDQFKKMYAFMDGKFEFSIVEYSYRPFI